MPTEPTSPTPAPVDSDVHGMGEAADMLAAFAKTAKERDALKDVPPVNVDVRQAVITVTGALPEIVKQKPAVLGCFREFDGTLFERLPMYAAAAGHAHVLYSAAQAPVPALLAMNEKAVGTRAKLMTLAKTLVEFELLDANVVGQYKGLTGYKNVSFELLGLVSVLRANWDTISSKIPLQKSQLDEAQVLGEKLIAATGLRDQAPAVTSSASDTRNRAVYLFVQAYEEIRGAIQYVRRKQGDADTIAPSLYVYPHKSKKGDDAPAAAPAPAPATPVVTAPHVGDAPPGTPGSNPFTA